MCSKPNPDHLEECQHCGARLKPLNLNQPVEFTPESEQPSDPSDWLRSLRPEDDQDISVHGEQLPGWLTESVPPPAPPGGDWLSQMRGDTTPADLADESWFGDLDALPEEDNDQPRDFNLGGTQIPARPATPAAADHPNWLDNLNTLTQTDPAAEPLPATENLPDWLTTLDTGDPAPPAEPPPSNWLDESPPPSQPTPAAEPGPAAPAPADDWLASFAAPTEPDQPAADTGAFPDWLDTTDTPPAAPIAAQTDLPDWLTTLQAQESAPADTPAGQALPDWLDQPIDSLPVPAASLPAQTPDWLASFASELEQPAEPAAPDAGADALPDWLQDVRAMDSAPAAPAPAGEEMPDWLAELHDKTPAGGTGGYTVEVPSGWDFDTPEKPAPARQPEPEAVDWLPGTSAAGLAGIVPSQPAGMPELAPGELPDWLKAMRPIDAAETGLAGAPLAAGGEAERAGPLAGLRGLLAAEPTVARAGKPPAYQIKLQVSDVQQNHAEVLRKMVEAETQTQPVQKAALISEQRVLRWVIVGVLLLAVLFPMLTPGWMSGLPAVPLETSPVGQMINAIPNGAPVLLIVDYEPGMSGELEAASSTVLDHLMLRGTRLAIVSTSPVGPALGEHLIDLLGVHNYQPGVHYVNLGFIPGGAAGLQGFGIAPQSALPLGYDATPLWGLLNLAGANPWGQAPLEGVTSLRDFQMTLLLSDDPDTVRGWVEQVEPRLAEQSLVVVSSAQAAPLIRPYFESGQVTGMVTGVSGGAYYEGFMGRERSARAFWDSYGVGSLAAVLLILGAGTWNLYLLYEEREAARRGRR
jgi:hypothetical protein